MEHGCHATSFLDCQKMTDRRRDFVSMREDPSRRVGVILTTWLRGPPRVGPSVAQLSPAPSRERWVTMCEENGCVLLVST